MSSRLPSLYLLLAALLPIGTPSAQDTASSLSIEGLDRTARDNIARRCLPSQLEDGAAAYRECVKNALDARAGRATAVLDRLSFDDRFALEQLCSGDDDANPAAVQACIDSQIGRLIDTPEPFLGLLDADERQAVTSECATVEDIDGLAGYRRCLNDVLQAVDALPVPDLTALSPSERSDLAQRCSRENATAVGYRRCLLGKPPASVTRSNLSDETEQPAQAVQQQALRQTEQVDNVLRRSEDSSDRPVALETDSASPSNADVAVGAPTEDDAPTTSELVAVGAAEPTVSEIGSNDDETGNQSTPDGAADSGNTDQDDSASPLVSIRERLTSSLLGLAPIQRVVLAGAAALPVVLLLIRGMSRRARRRTARERAVEELAVRNRQLVDRARSAEDWADESLPFDDAMSDMAAAGERLDESLTLPSLDPTLDDTLDATAPEPPASHLDLDVNQHGIPVTSLNRTSAPPGDTLIEQAVAVPTQVPPASPFETMNEPETGSPDTTRTGESRLESGDSDEAFRAASADSGNSTDFSLDSSLDQAAAFMTAERPAEAVIDTATTHHAARQESASNRRGALSPFGQWLEQTEQDLQLQHAIEFLIYWMAYSDARYEPEARERILAASERHDDAHDTIKRQIFAQDLDAFADTLRWLQANTTALQRVQVVDLLMVLLVADRTMTPVQNTFLRFLSDAFGMGSETLEERYELAFGYAMSPLPRVDLPNWWTAVEDVDLLLWDARAVAMLKPEDQYRARLGLPLDGEIAEADIIDGYNRAARRCHPHRFDALGERERSLAERQSIKFEEARDRLLGVTA